MLAFVSKNGIVEVVNCALFLTLDRHSGGPRIIAVISSCDLHKPIECVQSQAGHAVTRCDTLWLYVSLLPITVVRCHSASDSWSLLLGTRAVDWFDSYIFLLSYCWSHKKNPKAEILGAFSSSCSLTYQQVLTLFIMAFLILLVFIILLIFPRWDEASTCWASIAEL